MKGIVYIKTFGCQMNERDSRQMELLLARQGFSSTDRPDNADVILFNTCTIREKAYQKAMSDIGRMAELKDRRPHIRIGVCGCVAQQAKETLLARFPHVDFIVGPDQIGKIPEFVRRPVGSPPASAVDLVDDPGRYAFIDVVPEGAVPEGTAFVTIMKGCNLNCTYCIIPAVRGREVCRLADDVIDEVKRLVERGVLEVTLLGQTVDAWRDPTTRLSFSGLIRRLASETDIQRIRFVSPHPLHIGDDLMACYRDEPKLASHIHLPLQSGSNAVLKCMKRGYTREHYLKLVEKIRAARPHIAIGTDVIVGFCGETEEDFAQTLDFVEQVGFDALYAFVYSQRPGTFAEQSLVDDLPLEVKQERLDRLLELHREISRRNYEDKIGTLEDVLVTGYDRRERGKLSGRTGDNRIVNFEGSAEHIGRIVPLRIAKASAYSLEGVMG